MRYNWTTDDFLKQINLLRKIIEKETNPQRKLYLEKVLDSSEHLVFENLSSIKRPSESFKQRLYNINSERILYGRYYSLIQDFYFSLESLEDKIDEVESLLKSYFGEEFDISAITGSYLTNDLIQTYYLFLLRHITIVLLP